MWTSQGALFVGLKALIGLFGPLRHTTPQTWLWGIAVARFRNTHQVVGRSGQSKHPTHANWSPRCRSFLIPPTVFIQPKISSTRLRAEAKAAPAGRTSARRPRHLPQNAV